MSAAVPIAELILPVEKWNPRTNAPSETLDYIDISSVSQTEKRITETTKLLGREAPSRARQLVQPGDILVSTVRPNLNAVAFVTRAHAGYTASTGFSVLRPANNALDSRYLFHWVKTDNFVSAMMARSTGQSYPAVSDKVVKSSYIPLPPLAEQKRIAAILDKADGLRRQRRQALALLDTLTQSIFVEMFGGHGRPRIEIKSLAAVAAGNGFPMKYQGNEAGEIPFFKVGDMNLAGNEEEMHSSRNWISTGVAAEMRARIFPKGTVIFPKIGAAIATNKKRILAFDSCMDNNCMGLIPNEGTSPQYLLNCLRQTDLLEMAQPGNPPSIRKGDVEEWNVQLPMDNELNVFEGRVGKLRAISRSKGLHAAHLDTLFASLQSRAFAGEL